MSERCPRCGALVIGEREDGVVSVVHAVGGFDCLRAQLAAVTAERDTLTQRIGEACGDLAASLLREERLREAALAYRELTVCYRIGKRPTEKLFKRLSAADAALDAALRELRGEEADDA